MTLTIPEKLFFKIGEVSDITGLEPYILRYWESEFPLLKPNKNKAGQRLYTKNDVNTVIKIKTLLYEYKYTIEGARKYIAQQKKNEIKSAKEIDTQKDLKKCLLEVKKELLLLHEKLEKLNFN